MKEPTQEQLQIINNGENNLIIDASPGSGKTTTILHIAKKNSDLNLLQITYNTMLKNELRTKIKTFGIKNLEIHSYHSLVYNYYDNEGFDDEHIKKVLIKNNELKKEYPIKLDILLIDETQDMTMDYFKIIQKFLRDIKQTPRILLFGDYLQCIYQYKNATHQFLTLAQSIWKMNFIKLNLTTSFRLTNQISFFINNCMCNSQRIKTVRDNDKVDLYITNSFTTHTKIGNKILDLINKGYKEEDFFILVPSVKVNNAPFKKLENFLVKNKIKCITPVSDTTKLDDTLINEKVVFTTFHQSKGRERKIVIIYNFDMSYFMFYDKNANVKICPNVLYVACSRAIDKLILIQDQNIEPLPFINLNVKNIEQNVNIIKTTKKKIIPQKLKIENKFLKKSVTDLVKFLSQDTTNELIILLKDLFEIIKDKNIETNIQNKIQTTKNNYEDISDLNGIVIPAIFEKNNSQSNLSSIEFFVMQHCETHPEIKKYISKFNVPCTSIEDYLKIGNIYLAIQNKLHSKIAQIKKYDWISDKNMEDCLKNMEFLTNKNLLYEYKITNNDTLEEEFFIFNHEIFGEVKISSRIDAFDNENIYEFKCVNVLTTEHKLQLIFYYWLWHNSILKNSMGLKNAILLNIQTGQILKLKNDMHKINLIIDLIITDKFKNNLNHTDEEFINLF